MSISAPKFRYVHELAGFFVLLTMLAAVGAIVWAARLQQWFEPKFELKAIFESDEGAFGLQKGAEIRMFEVAAGTVSDIAPDSKGRIVATFELNRKFQDSVRIDAAAKVRKQFAVFGDAYVVIYPGTRDMAPMPSGALIPCGKDTELLDVARDVLEDLREEYLPTITQLRIVLDELPTLTLQIESSLLEFERVMQSIQRHWLLRDYVEPRGQDAPMSSLGLGSDDDF